MNCQEFTTFLQEQIPLTAAMQLQTDFFSKEKIRLSVPLAPSCGFGQCPNSKRLSQTIFVYQK